MNPSLIEIGETAHALRRAFDRRAATLGVTRAQWRVLVRLSRQPGLRQVDLADCLDVEPITLCRIVDRLEERGLVERRPAERDRRIKLVALTKEGEALRDELARRRSVPPPEFAELSEAELRKLRQVFAKLAG